MKRSTIILIGSLALNGVLLLGFAVVRHNQSTHPSNAVVAEPTQSPSSASSQTDSELERTRGATKPLWSLLETKKLDELSANLHAAGFPPSVVVEIIRSLLLSQYLERKQQLLGNTAEQPYWRSRNRPGGETDDPKLKAELAAIEREFQKTYLKYAFSGDDLEDAEQLAKAKFSYGNLPAWKLQRLAGIRSDYMEMMMELYSAVKPNQEPSADAMQKIALLEKEQRADIVKTLTPEELAEYDLHASSTARFLRSQLANFQPTEAEYRALFSLAGSGDDASDGPSAFAKLNQLKTQAETVLTAERYQDFLQAMSFGSDKLSKLITRLELPLSTVGKVNSIRDDINQRATTIRADSSLDAETQSAQLGALAEEAKTKLLSTLGGTRGYEAYEDMKGDWIRVLQPKTTTTAK